MNTGLKLTKYKYGCVNSILSPKDVIPTDLILRRLAKKRGEPMRFEGWQSAPPLAPPFEPAATLPEGEVRGRC